jgi:hypothetical protein
MLLSALGNRFVNVREKTDVRMCVAKRSVRPAGQRARRGEKTQESVVLSVDVGVLFALEDYMRGQTKKERLGENHTCSSSISALSSLISSFFWFSVSEP